MVDFYVMMIHKNAITLDKVPGKWRAAVEKALKGDE